MRHATFELHSSRRRGIEGCELVSLRIAAGTDFLDRLTGQDKQIFFHHRSAICLYPGEILVFQQIHADSALFDREVVFQFVFVLGSRRASCSWMVGGICRSAHEFWQHFMFLFFLDFEDVFRFHQIPCVWFFDHFFHFRHFSQFFDVLWVAGYPPCSYSKKHLENQGTCWTCRRVMSAHGVSRCYTSPAVVICRCDLWYQRQYETELN